MMLVMSIVGMIMVVMTYTDDDGTDDYGTDDDGTDDDVSYDDGTYDELISMI